jgi:hypothetical protein
VVDGRRCAVSAVTPLQNRDYASVARDSERLRTATLPAVTIRERKEVRRSFGGSPSYCFATRNVRAGHPTRRACWWRPIRAAMAAIATTGSNSAATAASSTRRS